MLLVERDAGLGDAALALGSALTLGLCLVAVGMLVRQWRAAAAPERRSLVPVFASGGVSLALVAAYATTQIDALLWMAFAAFAATPFAFLAGLARADLSGSRGVRTLMAQLADAPERADLRDALARALGDPALELAFWMPELNRYVDADGAPAELPGEDDARRTVTEIDHHGEHVAAIVHDRAQDTETVRAAGAATALMLENQRLDAELRARLVELRASRARLVEAADGERRRLERNLHDGAQSRLVALALNLRLARMTVADGSDTAALLDGSIDELGQSLKELRDLARGIHPAVLSERGLEPAVRALAARAPVPVDIVGQAAGRLPAAVETAAYFVVSEALTNVSKYAHAEHATVRVERVNGQLLVEVSDDGVGGANASDGSGLRGLSDRVAALSGTLEVSSPPGSGHPAASPAALHVTAAADRPLRVVVAEDSFLLRAGVVHVLEDTGFVVVGEARDAEELLDQVREHRPRTVGGFKLYVEDRASLGFEELYQEVQGAIGAGYGDGRLTGLFSSFQVSVPQIDAHVDRERAKTYGVALTDVFETLQVYLGSLYVNDFNRFGRTYQVNVQAESRVSPAARTNRRAEDQERRGSDDAARFAGQGRWNLRARSGHALQRVSGRGNQRRPGAGRQLEPGTGRHRGHSGRKAPARHVVRMDGAGLSGAARGQHHALDLSVVRAPRLRRAGGAVRELVAAAQRDPDRADDHPVGDHRRLADGWRQQRVHPDQLSGAGRSCLQECHPHRGVRQTARGGRRGPRSPRSSTPAASGSVRC